MLDNIIKDSKKGLEVYFNKIEEIEEFKEEHNCSTCTKNIECKIVRRIDGKLTCTEEE